MQWKIIDTGPACAKVNMEVDASLLRELSEGSPILHLYAWEKPSATFGYFTRPDDYLRKEGIEERGVEVVRRPTGGGIIFHLTDFAFSLLIPATHPRYSINILENYAYVNGMVIESVKQLLPKTDPCLWVAPDKKEAPPFCMAAPTKFDVVLDGKKIGGAAQRRTKVGFLHQGSISISLPKREFLTSVIKAGSSLAEAIEKNTYCLIPEASQQEIEDVREELKKILIKIVLTAGCN